MVQGGLRGIGGGFEGVDMWGRGEVEVRSGRENGDGRRVVRVDWRILCLLHSLLGVGGV